ncbi:MAG: CPBP family intramembrane glutamic endopeptidase [Huintestinicola sp.]
MEKIRLFFRIPDSYIQKIKNYSIIDAAMALGLFFLYCIAMVFCGLIVNSVSKFAITVIGGVINLGFVGMVLGLLFLRKQGIDTIGLKNGNIKLSLIMGTFLAAILFFCNCLSNVLFEGQKFISIDKIAINILYYYTVGLAEEVIFRGYIGTRLCGFIKNVYVVTFITGLLFVLMHFPFRMAAYHMTFLELASNFTYMIDLFVTHLILSFIYIRSDSLYGAILSHWVSDLAYSIVTHL